MRLGVLSDSHGRVEITRRAVRALLEAGAQRIIHLGDVETTEVIEELAGCAAHLVFGNCDDDIPALTRHAEALGVQVDHPMGQMTVQGKRVAYTHGHHQRLIDRAVERRVDFLLHGHTHQASDVRIGDTRIINPGALFRARRYTAALLDPAADHLSIVEVPSPDH